ncbi:methyltransferase type 11, partial [Actinoplanes philippinensis]
MTNATSEVAGTPSQYTFSNTFDAGSQLRLLAAILDQHTQAVLAETGIDLGWKCLDVGAGARPRSAGMGDQVGPAGHLTGQDTPPQHHPRGGTGNVR